VRTRREARVARRGNRLTARHMLPDVHKDGCMRQVVIPRVEAVAVADGDEVGSRAQGARESADSELAAGGGDDATTSGQHCGALGQSKVVGVAELVRVRPRAVVALHTPPFDVLRKRQEAAQPRGGWCRSSEAEGKPPVLLRLLVSHGGPREECERRHALAQLKQTADRRPLKADGAACVLVSPFVS